MTIRQRREESWQIMMLHRKTYHWLFIAFGLMHLTACAGGGNNVGGNAGGILAENEQRRVPLSLKPEPPYRPDPAFLTDTEYRGNWGLDAIRAAAAYSRGHTGAGVTIAILDRSIYSDHIEFSGQLVTGYDGGVDWDGHVNSICVTSTDCEIVVEGKPNTLYDHGTHVAAIAAGKRNLDGAYSEKFAGTHGVAYDAKIKPVQVLGVSTPQAVPAIEAQAMDNTITVLNNSWGYTRTLSRNYNGSTVYYTSIYDNTRISSAIKNAFIAVANSDKIIVFAAGNTGHNSLTGRIELHESIANAESDDPLIEPIAEVSWNSIRGGRPTNLAGGATRLPLIASALRGRWIAVVATDQKNRITSFSNGCGDMMHYCLAAPGDRIWSASISTTSRDSRLYYTLKRGTSMAAPHVSGAIAVLKSAYPMMSKTALVSLLLDTATDMGEPGTDPVYGRGLLNLNAATLPVGEESAISFGHKILSAGVTIGNSQVILPSHFGGAMQNLELGFTDDYHRAFIGTPSRIVRKNISYDAFDYIATWQTHELEVTKLSETIKMSYANVGTDDAVMNIEHQHGKIGLSFSYDADYSNPDFRLAGKESETHFQKIRSASKDLMQIVASHKLSDKLYLQNSALSGAYDTGNQFSEMMSHLHYQSEALSVTAGFGSLREYSQFLGATGKGAYALDDATRSQVTHLTIAQKLPKSMKISANYTGFNSKVDMRYHKFADISGLKANEYRLTFKKSRLLSKSDSISLDIALPFAITEGNLQQRTVLGYTEAGTYNNVVQNYALAPDARAQKTRLVWQNQQGKNKQIFLAAMLEDNAGNVKNARQSNLLGGIKIKF